MAKINLNKMSLEELKQLQKDVTKAIDDFKERKRNEAIAAAEAAVKELGFSLKELTGAPVKKSKTKNPPKYAHPENPAKTWTGRGRKPEWIKDAEAEGKSLEEFAI